MTYQDLLISGRFKPAAEFFLTELYGDRNYERRDTQFGRIAGAIQKLLPESTQGTAVALAQLHLKTEYFDHSMGLKLATDNIQMRSASRVGYSDFGKNRARLQEIRSAFEPCCN